MRERTGRLIAVWVPGNHGAGGSTLADSIGIALQHFTGKKVLIANLSGSWSYMERFFENDICIKYTMDYFKGFRNDLQLSHISTFATHINDRLSIIPGSRLKREIGHNDVDFESNLIEKCLVGYDFVIADVITGVKRENIEILEKSDMILAVLTPNEIMMDDIYNEVTKIDIYNYMINEKTIAVFNMMNPDISIERELARLNKKYKIKNSFGMAFDGRVFEACCKNKKLYSYLVQELSDSSSSFPEQLEQLCGFISDRFEIDYLKTENRGFINRLLNFRQVVGHSEKVFSR